MFPYCRLLTEKCTMSSTKTSRNRSHLQMIPPVVTLSVISSQTIFEHQPGGVSAFGASPLAGRIPELQHRVCALSYIALIEAGGSSLYDRCDTARSTAYWLCFRRV